jgi:hypothetical protein
MIKKAIRYAAEKAKLVFFGSYIRTTVVLFSVLVSAIVLTTMFKANLSFMLESAYTDSPRPIESMVFVKRTNTLEFVTCIDLASDSPHICDLFTNPLLRDEVTAFFNIQFAYSISGSAAVISHDMHRNSSNVISAYHVCNDFNTRHMTFHMATPTPHILIYKYTPSISLTDYFGNSYHASEIRVDPSNDACVLGTDSMMDNISPVRVASNPPTPGERIYNIASPHGLSRPGAVLSYEGYYAGVIPGNRTIQSQHYLFAIPTAPGSSGSIVLNSEGEIISVISYGFITRSQGPVPPHDMWPNASAGPSLKSLRDLTDPRIIR